MPLFICSLAGCGPGSSEENDMMLLSAKFCLQSTPTSINVLLPCHTACRASYHRIS